MSFQLISTVTVGSGGAASIDFTSIPQTYTDLQIVLSGRSTTTDSFCYLGFNGSTANFSARFLYGDGSSASSSTDTKPFIYTTSSAFDANIFGNGSIYIPNYTGSTFKSISIDSTSERNATGSPMVIEAGLWSQTAAITRATLTHNGTGLFTQYSTASLYGILKGSGGATVS